MKYRENDILVDPVYWRPSEVNVLLEIFRDNINFLIVVRTDIELEITFAGDQRSFWNEQLYR